LRFDHNGHRDHSRSVGARIHAYDRHRRGRDRPVRRGVRSNRQFVVDDTQRLEGNSGREQVGPAEWNGGLLSRAVVRRRSRAAGRCHRCRFSRSGIAAVNSGDLATAEAKLRASVEADGQNAETLNNLGQVLVRAGKAQEAIAYFDRAIAIADTVWAYRFNRARAYAEMKDWANAIAAYTDASRLFPTDYATHFNLAKAREASGDLPGAVESYGKAAELAPGQADFQLWYGRALDRAGRQQDAVAAYKRFLELEPSAPQAEKVRARLAQLGASTGESSSRSS
jgi:tetratricopeptide (TPR) repeat protein